MITTKTQLKRTQDALACIDTGKRVRLPAGRWRDPVHVTRSGWLYVDEVRTTLRSYPALAHHELRWTADDVRMLCSVLRDERDGHRLWLRVWDSDRGVHILEPAGTDAEKLDHVLAHRFPCGVNSWPAAA